MPIDIEQFLLETSLSTSSESDFRNIFENFGALLENEGSTQGPPSTIMVNQSSEESYEYISQVLQSDPQLDTVIATLETSSSGFGNILEKLKDMRDLKEVFSHPFSVVGHYGSHPVFFAEAIRFANSTEKFLTFDVQTA